MQNENNEELGQLDSKTIARLAKIALELIVERQELSMHGFDKDELREAIIRLKMDYDL